MPSVGSGLGSGLFSFAVSQVLGGLLTWVGSGTTWLLDQVGQVLDTTTEVQLKGAWFTHHLVAMGELAGVLVLPLLLVAAGHAVVRQDASMLLRVLAVQLPLAVIFSLAAVEVVQLSLDWVDLVSSWVAGATSHGGLKSVLDQLAGGLSGQSISGVTPAFVALVSEVVMAVGAFALWLELAIRGAAIYLAVLFVPLVIAGLVWPVTARLGRRLAETIAALILSKLVMVAALGLAAGALTGGLVRGELASVVDGVALLLLAVFAPYTLLRLLPFVEAGAVGHLEGAGRRMVASTVGLSARVAGGFSAASAGMSFEEHAPSTVADHGGSPTPPHLTAILGDGPRTPPADSPWPGPAEPPPAPGQDPPPWPSGGGAGAPTPSEGPAAFTPEQESGDSSRGREHLDGGRDGR